MKILVNCKRLLELCRIVKMIVPKTTTNEVLKDVKITAYDSYIEVAGTDAEVGYSSRLDTVTVFKIGEVVLPADKLVQILSSIDDEEVEIQSDKKIIIRWSKGEHTIGFVDPSLFLTYEDSFAAKNDDDDQYEANAEAVGNILEQVQFAAAKNDTRFTLNCICLEFVDNDLRAIATDTKVLAYANTEVSPLKLNSNQVKKSYLVPIKAAEILCKVLKNPDLALIRLSKNRLMIQVGNDTVWTRLLEGQFPPYEAIIPQKFDHVVEIPIKEFSMVVKQASVMTDKEANRVAFDFKPGTLTLSTFSQIGTSEVQMACEGYTGQKSQVILNPDIVIPILQAAGKDGCVHFQIVDNERKPVAIINKKNFISIVMPMAASVVQGEKK